MAAVESSRREPTSPRCPSPSTTPFAQRGRARCPACSKPSSAPLQDLPLPPPSSPPLTNCGLQADVLRHAASWRHRRRVEPPQLRPRLCQGPNARPTIKAYDAALADVICSDARLPHDAQESHAGSYIEAVEDNLETVHSRALATLCPSTTPATSARPTVGKSASGPLSACSWSGVSNDPLLLRVAYLPT